MQTEQPTKSFKMFCSTSKTEGEVGAVNMFKRPSNHSLLTVPRWYFCCGSLLPVFGVRVFVGVSPYVWLY